VKPGTTARQGSPAAPPRQTAPAAPKVPTPISDPVPPSNEFRADPAASSTSSRGRYRRKQGPGKFVWIAVCLLMTGGLIAGGIFGAKYLDGKLGKEKKDTAHAAGPGDGKTDGAQHAAKSGAFPRRLLFIHISKYMFLNPLTASAQGAPDRTKGAAYRMAFDWRVPTEKENNQLFVLSDSAPPEKGQPVQVPLKNVLMGAYEQFFNTSRAQDRIVVYFGGHALEKDGVAYIAPVEADLDEPETLIPLEDFYAKLKACKASQKVVVWDVCRFNPDRGRQRPGSEPMSEALAKALMSPPDGVEAVATCQPGENALEFYSLQLEPAVNAPKYSGSSFLESMKYVAEKSKGGKAPAPGDSIPVGEWSTNVGNRVSAMAAATTEKLKQTVAYAGKLPAQQTPFNPEEPAPKRFEWPQPPKGSSPAEIKSIESEFVVPAIRADLTDTGLGDLPFKEEIMKDYKSDVPLDTIEKDKEKYKFQATTLEAFRTLRDLWVVGSSGGPQMRESIKAPITDDLKKEINKELEFWAVGIAKLELVNIALDELEPLKDSQTKRWQAHYQYARAVVKARLAFMNEYNKLMGDVRTETLPPRDDKLGQDSYRLISSEKMKSKKDIQKLAEDAQEAYSKLITDYKGTPWSIQAKRDKSFYLGLVWRPFNSAKPTE
jgi:hypothetical protein